MNQYTQIGGTTYSYDADGNLSAKTDAGGTTTYTYDAENRLIRVVSPTDGTWVYTYDALGQRQTSSHNGMVSRVVQDPGGIGAPAAEYNGSGALVRRYIQGAGLVSQIDGTGQTAYYAFDGGGNTRQLTNAAGQVASSYEYDSFGAAQQVSETIHTPSYT